MKKLLAMLLVLTLALTLCACNKDKPTGSNVPDNVIPPKTTEEVTQPNDDNTPVTQPSEQAGEAADSSLPEEELTPDETLPQEDGEEPKPDDEDNDEVVIDDGDEEEGPYVDISEVIDIHQYKAFESLYLLNSDKVHAKFMEAVTYDGEYISGTEREIFVLGDRFAYITDDSLKIFNDPDNGEVTLVDYANGVMCVYDEEDYFEEGDRFGYGIENYENISVTEEDGVVTEVFEIETYGGTITSTWTFCKDNTIVVTDVIDDSGAYYVYDFEVLEKAFLTAEMNGAVAFAAPGPELELISIEEYEENY